MIITTSKTTSTARGVEKYDDILHRAYILLEEELDYRRCV